MTVRLAISVEGDTEERFVKDLLHRHLADFDVQATPIKVTTGRAADGRPAKGGGINRDRVIGEIGRLFRSFDAVTTLYDYYGFQGRADGETVDQLQRSLFDRLGSPANFIPYIQLHEFEALLLSDAAVAADYFQLPTIAPSIEEAVRRGGPESVNDTPQTAPSKRLEKWTERATVPRRFTKRTKVRHGPELAVRLTLPVIRRACPRFDRWVTCLEQLGGR